MLQNIFKEMLVTSFVGTVLALILTLFKPITKKRFSSGWHYYMWLVVLVSMILPVKIIAPQKAENAQKAEAVPQIFEEQTNGNVQPTAFGDEGENFGEVERKNEVGFNSKSLSRFAKDEGGTIALIWFCVMIMLFAFKLAGYFVFLSKLRRNSRAVSCPELLKFTDKKVAARTSGKISSPLMTGIFKPTLLLPKTPMTPQQLDNVLAHEMTHFKRKDILYKWFLTAVKCVHWFNPVVYYIDKQVNTECEISCDLAVVNKMSEEQKICYIDTILDLLSTGNSKTAEFTTGMTSDKKTLKARFVMIKNKVAISKRAMVVSVALALVTVCGAVLASGLLNRKFIGRYENELLAVSTDTKENGDFNLLMLGVDEHNRADTIMILSLEDGKASGIFIPRDTAFVSENMDKKVKLSEILKTENGDQKAIDAVKRTLGVPVNYYAKVKLSAVKEVVDCVGGMEFDVPADMEYDDPFCDLHIRLKKGRHKLNGEEVCGLLRFKRSNNGNGYAKGDITRIETGQRVITEFIRQKLDKKFINKLPAISAILFENTETNYPLKNLAEDIKLLDKTKGDITFRTISGELKTEDNGIVFYYIDSGEIFSAAGYPDSTASDEKQEHESVKVLAPEAKLDKKSLFEEKNAVEEKASVKETSYTPPNASVRSGETKIKFTEEVEDLYNGFELLVLKNADTDKIKSELNGLGMVEASGSFVDLTKNYAVKTLDSEQTKVASDKNGNISLYLSVNSENLFNVRFCDEESGEEVGSYVVFANNENAYTFTGFEKGKTYNAEVERKTKNDWAVEGSYIIY